MLQIQFGLYQVRLKLISANVLCADEWGPILEDNSFAQRLAGVLGENFDIKLYYHNPEDSNMDSRKTIDVVCSSTPDRIKNLPLSVANTSNNQALYSISDSKDNPNPVFEIVFWGVNDNQQAFDNLITQLEKIIQRHSRGSSGLRHTFLPPPTASDSHSEGLGIGNVTISSEKVPSFSKLSNS